MANACPQCQQPVAVSIASATRARCPRCLHTFSIEHAELGRGPVRSGVQTLPQPSQLYQDLTLPPHLAALRQTKSEAETLSYSTRTPAPGRSLLQSISGIDTDESTVRFDPLALPKFIPGFHIEGVIGHGGMGSVYLARQLSLDRPVALKVMSQEWVSDPVFVARFIREAFAAALLSHPNVVQIYDIGEIENTRYFSMEYVPGQSLLELVKDRGRLEPDVAVGYILQAARGLKHAHDRGIIHRDIKPDNLLLDEHGTVKVADLGLVKTPDMSKYQDRLFDGSASDSGLHTLPQDMTGVRMALGTPAYMAPEQCRDASAVDHRADIYSLGCTLYALVTGRQPFEAKDPVGLMKQHAYEPLIPPETLVPRLSPELSAVIQTMMAKHPGARFANMGEVVRTLENWLGVKSAGRFIPREDQIAEVESLAVRFRTTPTAVARQRIVSGFVSGCALAAVLLAFFGHTIWAFGCAGLVVQAAFAYFVLNGWTRKTHLARRVRAFVRGSSIGDWVVAIGALGLFAAFLWMSQLLAVWVGFGLLGLAAAVALWYVLDRKLEAERFPILRASDELHRRLQHHGVAGEEIRLFFAKYSGRQWEEYFEAVFGFEAKLATRSLLLRGGSAGIREKYAAWREPLVQLLNHVDSLRRRARERGLLEQTECERLIAAGVPKRIARSRAAHAADAMVDQAGAIRNAPAPSSSSAHAPNLREIIAHASHSMPGLGNEPVPRDYVGTAVDWLVGTWVRVIVAALLLAASFGWVLQNDLIRFTARNEALAETAPLRVEILPDAWTSWCDTANVGWGGLLLLTSLFYRGQRSAALALLGAGITVFGHQLGIRTVEPIRDTHVAMMLGTVIALLGFRLGRR